MQTHSNPPRRKNSPILFMAVSLAAAVGLTLYVTVGRPTHPQIPSVEPTITHSGSVDATDGDPAIAVPKALSLTLDLPPLSDEQRKYLHEAQTVWRCPLCLGVDKPVLSLTDNEAVLYVALIYTESRLLPYDETGEHKVSSSGCMGLAQLCGDLLTDETRTSDELNLYAGAAEFHRLVSGSADYNEAVESYKGVLSGDVKWESDTVWALVRVSGGK